MTQNEVIKELLSIGIIAEIGGEFFITEKYKELITISKNAVKLEVRQPGKSRVNTEDIVNTSGSMTTWPSEIAHTTGRTRAEALMNLAGVPSHSPDGSYMLRGLTKDSLTIIDNIVANEDISPIDMINAIKLYYAHTKMPKGFKNLLLEGLVVDVYNEYISGALVKNLKPPNKTNETWR